MPTLPQMNIPTPKSWDEFEEITLSSLKIKWGNSNLTRNGRQGQKQDGVDIYGDDDLNRFVGVQCKLTENSISYNDIQNEIVKAENFKPALEILYIATTSKRDSKIQEELRLLSRGRIAENKFLVEILYWDDLIQELTKDSDEFSRYYPQIIIKSERKPSTYIPKNNYEKNDFYLNRMVVLCGENKEEDYFFYEEKKFDLIDVLNDHKKMVLLGDAGVGKSSELKSVAAYYSKEETALYPYLVMLNTYIDQEIEALISPDWTDVPKSSVLLIMDGFDEIESQYKKNFIKRIELFAGKYPQITILISCRSNFYTAETEKNSGFLDAFKSCFLTQLDNQQIETFIKEELGAKSYRFTQNVKSKGLRELIEVPFYLINLIKIFNDHDDELPDNKADIFGLLIENRWNYDIKHFKNTPELENEKAQILEVLQKIAVVMETLGRNYISNEEYLQIVSGEEVRELLSHCTAWVKKDSNEKINWEFEHNNFQEFLAAKKLSTQPLETIQSFVSFNSGENKIIPSWVNTISFILNMFKDNGLIDWVLEFEPEIIIKFEPDRVNEAERIEIVKQIFNSYKERKISINREKFGFGEIGRFCNSGELIDFLIEESKRSNEHLVTGNAMRIISEMEIAHLKRNDVREFLMFVAIQTEFPEHTINKALITLSKLKLITEEISKEIISKFKTSKSDWIRYGLYYYINGSNDIDKYVDVYLDGIKFVRFDSNRLLDEKMRLVEGLTKVTSPEAIKKIISFIIQSDQQFTRFIRAETDVIKKIIDNAIVAYSIDPSIYNCMMDFFKFIKKNYFNKLFTIAVGFFFKTQTQGNAFETLLNEGIKKYNAFLTFLVDEVNLEYLTEMYRKKKISHEELQCFINGFDFKKNDTHIKYFESINKEFDNSFKQQQSLDFDKLRRDRVKKDLSLFFDKNAFVYEIKHIFTDLKLEQISKKVLTDISIENGYKNEYSELLIDKLYQIVNDNSMSLDEILSIVNLWNWDVFWIYNVYKLLKNNQDDEFLTEEQKQKVLEWCDKQLLIVNYKDAIEKTGEHSFSVNNLARRLWFFIKKFEIKCSEKVMLDLLSFDYHDGVIEYLEEYLDPEKMTIRILDNLYNDDMCEAVTEKHLAFCKRHKIVDSTDFAIRNIINSKSVSRSSSLSLLYELPSGVEELVKILPEIQDDFRWRIIDKLIDKKSSELETILETIFLSEIKADKYKAAVHLVRLQNLDAIEYYIDELKNCETFTMDMYHDSPLIFVCDVSVVPLLIDLLGESYKGNIINQDDDEFETIARLVRKTLKNIALQSEDNYFIVKNSLESFINDNVSEFEEVKWLYPFIDELESQHYVNKSKNINIQDAIAKVNLLS